MPNPRAHYAQEVPKEEGVLADALHGLDEEAAEVLAPGLGLHGAVGEKFLQAFVRARLALHEVQRHPVVLAVLQSDEKGGGAGEAVAAAILQGVRATAGQ
jgi:hypothetical protein